jgi:hypothetical protein
MGRATILSKLPCSGLRTLNGSGSAKRSRFFATKAAFLSQDGRRVHMTSADELQCSMVEHFRKVGPFSPISDYGRCCIEIAAALDERKAEELRLKSELLP